MRCGSRTSRPLAKPHARSSDNCRIRSSSSPDLAQWIRRSPLRPSSAALCVRSVLPERGFSWTSESVYRFSADFRWICIAALAASGSCRLIRVPDRNVLLESQRHCIRQEQYLMQRSLQLATDHCHQVLDQEIFRDRSHGDVKLKVERGKPLLIVQRRLHLLDHRLELG